MLTDELCRRVLTLIELTVVEIGVIKKENGRTKVKRCNRERGVVERRCAIVKVSKAEKE